MSSSKVTAGPWIWSNKHETYDGRPTWSLVGAGGYGILSCDGEGNSPHGLGDDANTRLIAEAGTVCSEIGLSPRELAEQREELLGALEDILDSVAMTESSGEICQKDDFKQARAAIRKARGEPVLAA